MNSPNKTEEDFSLLRDTFIRNPQLHHILAVASVFYQAPSPLQISNVLDITWEFVVQSLVPVARLLDSPASPAYHYSDIILSSRLRELLSDRTCGSTFVDPPRWHALVAVWCLARSSIKYDARDIFYASDFWAQHVCSARPSQDIWDALRRSPLPCRSSSRSMLPPVAVDTEDTRELIVLYHTVYRQTTAASVRQPRGDYGWHVFHEILGRAI
ncbi:hypothetical protein C8R47DRAFT_1325904 [Mycena vitilis]|nr:hypothetical protein C8R47DRAFT_1325904 [Mycena vitilis]